MSDSGALGERQFGNSASRPMPGFFPARVIPVAASGQIRNRRVLANLRASSPNTSWGTGLNRMLTSVAVASKMSNASTRSDAMRPLLVRRDEPRRRDHGAAAGEKIASPRPDDPLREIRLAEFEQLFDDTVAFCRRSPTSR